jgi:peptidyl-prolyl cis-trans isomerase C
MISMRSSQGSAIAWALLLLSTFGTACSKGESTAGAAATEPAAGRAVPDSSRAASEPAGNAAASAPTTGAETGSGYAPAADEILDPDALPEVVARVDGVAVTRAELLARAAEARGALAQRGVAPPPPSRGFFVRVLGDLIGNRLLHRDLVARGKGAPAAEVEEQMKALQAQFQSPEQLDAALASRGMDRERLRADLAESLTVRQWVLGEIAPSIEVADSETRAYYDEHPEQMVEPEKVHARHILVRLGEQATAEERAEKRRAVEELRTRLLAGADFSTLARESSDDRGSAERGGDLGWFYRGQMVPPFESAAFGLAPEQLSAIVETRFGFHLVEVLEKRPETKIAYDEVRERLQGMLRQRKLEERIRARVDELVAQARVDLLI